MEESEQAAPRTLTAAGEDKLWVEVRVCNYKPSTLPVSQVTPIHSSNTCATTTPDGAQEQERPRSQDSSKSFTGQTRTEMPKSPSVTLQMLRPVSEHLA